MISKINKIKLKKATKKDLPLIEKLLRENELPYEDIPPKLHSKLHCMFIAHINTDIDTKVLGIIGVEIYGKYGLLRSLVVEEPFRGKGYGKALCLQTIEYAKSRGVGELYLLTATAEKFCQKLGFESIERKLAPKVIQQTSQFSQVCCSESAVCMRLII
jgi:amino-acid N-acetyltransferase